MKSFFAGALACLALSSAASAAESYARLNFNPDWKFIKADPAGAAQIAFDDKAWTSVSLPHAFNDAGRAWYRKTFALPESFKGKKVFVEFEAVQQSAEVCLNGQLLGSSKTGSVPFGFDLTPHLKFGGAKNVIAVRAGGGIYRNIYLHVTDPLHISLPLYSFLQTAGPYVYAADLTPESARIEVEVPVQNERTTEAVVQIAATILGPDGKAVLTLQEKGQFAASSSAEVTLSGVLSKPLLWEPSHPNLYHAVISLRVGSKEADSREVTFGIRTVKWDDAAGLSINGHPEKLRGGEQPTDWAGIGAAKPDWMYFYKLRLMKEAGANFVRWGQGEDAPAMFEAADRLGLVTEQSGVDGDAEALRDRTIYFRNHPSILFNQKPMREQAEELRGHTIASTASAPPLTLRITPTTGPAGLLADGSDVVLIEVEALDANGERCPFFQYRVDFEISGPGVWPGNTRLNLESGMARVAIRSTRSAGTITIKAKTEGLKPASLAIPSKAFAAPNGIGASLPAYVR